MVEYNPSSATKAITVGTVTVVVDVTPTSGYVGDVFTFSGMVTEDTTAVPGAGVDIILEETGAVVASGGTGSAGTFSIDWTADRTGTLHFHAESLGATSPTVTITVEELINTNLTIDSPGFVREGESFNVTGTLTRVDTGAGLSGMTINIFQNTTSVGSTTTDTNGNYSFAMSLPTAGTYELTAEFPGTATAAAASATIGITTGVVEEEVCAGRPILQRIYQMAVERDRTAIANWIEQICKMRG